MKYPLTQGLPWATMRQLWAYGADMRLIENKMRNWPRALGQNMGVNFPSIWRASEHQGRPR